MDKVYITTVKDYNDYANERYQKAVEAWSMGKPFPYYGMFTFDKSYGYVRYRVNEAGTVLSARWARTKKSLYES